MVMTSEQMIQAADLLDRLEAQNKADTGYGSCTVRGIANSLRHGDDTGLSAAQSEWHCDGDKVYQHPKLRQALIDILGCRLHHTHDCTHWICSGVKPSTRME
jgi:hypothetical protein